MMKAFLPAVLIAIMARSVALAGETGPVLGGEAPVAKERCVEVEIAGEKASRLDCVNQELRRTVERTKPPANVAPLDASSPAVQVGGFNEAATSQQLGKNFGKSVIPDRPAVLAPSPAPR